MKIYFIIGTLSGFIYVYFYYKSKKKYQDPSFLAYIEQIHKFFERIEKFDDYVTWVMRDQIKAEYSGIGN